LSITLKIGSYLGAVYVMHDPSRRKRDLVFLNVAATRKFLLHQPQLLDLHLDRRNFEAMVLSLRRRPPLRVPPRHLGQVSWVMAAIQSACEAKRLPTCPIRHRHLAQRLVVNQSIILTRTPGAMGRLCTPRDTRTGMGWITDACQDRYHHM
jgi:hypothetical protein